jgi:hypothetical protein
MVMTYTAADPLSGYVHVIEKHVPEFKPRTLLGKSILRALPHLPADLAAEIVDRIKSAIVVETSLAIKVMRGHGLYLAGLIPMAEVVTEDYGVVSRKVVTDAGVGFIVDAFQNSVELENMKYHALGTGSTAEAAGDTALVTELTTEYTGNVRATGTTTEGATANIYKTVATNTLDGTPGAALREHGVFSANAAGVLLDRSVFAAITLSSGDSLQSSYELTLSSGG